MFEMTMLVVHSDGNYDDDDDPDHDEGLMVMMDA